MNKNFIKNDAGITSEIKDEININGVNEKNKNVFVEIRDIVKVYDDNYKAVNKINLDINKGEFVTILGPSGCGKTTLLKMIGGFELPTSGKILVKKIDIKDLPIQRRPTATVFQDYALFPNMNVEKNISYGLKEIRKPLENTLPDYHKESEKYFNECLKKSKSKSKDIEKDREGYLKEIEKIKNRINSKPILQEVNKMSDDEYENKIEEIEKEYESKYDKNLYKSIPFKIKFIELLNNFLSFLRINKNIEYRVSKADDTIVKKYLNYERSYRENLILNNKIKYLNYRANDLDYWVSYWQNYPYQEQEWYEMKKLTRKLNKKEIQEEVNKIIQIIGLEGKEKKMPSDLSGGMQQRVALARALVIKPDILLLDEPLSALDAKVRVQMQQELKNLHKKFGITFILVTHDQEEALTLSDKIVVMSQGKIQQIGSPTEIYDFPTNNWVANFIGNANIFSATYLGKNKIKLFNKVLKIDKRYSNFSKDEEVNVMIRPEDFDVTTSSNGKIKVIVLETIYKGLMWELVCEFEGNLLKIEAVNKVKEDQEIYLTWDDEDMHVMKKNDELDLITDELSEFEIVTKNVYKKRMKEIKNKKNLKLKNGKGGSK